MTLEKSVMALVDVLVGVEAEVDEEEEEEAGPEGP
jgi:hypothetical protein